MINLRGVDLNLLPVFEAVYEERSLTKAADRLSMSQPAVSNAVARLRSVFNDELFVRHGRGVSLTPTADGIYARLHGALGSIRDSVSDRRGFDSRSSTRSFSISVPHPLGPLLAVRVRDQLAVAAPGIKISFSTRSRPVEQDKALLDGRFDAAVDWLMPGRSQFRNLLLFDDGMVAVARRGHSALRNVHSKSALNSLDFVSLRPRADPEGLALGVAAWVRLKLSCALEVSELLEVLLVASQSDLVGLVPRSMLKLAGDAFGLKALPVSVSEKKIPIRLFWAANKTADPAQIFIRSQIEAASREVIGQSGYTLHSARSGR